MLITIAILPSRALGTPGCGKWDITACSTAEMFPKSPISRRKRLQNSRKQKITVADIVSTTVTYLVAEEGFEPTTFGL